MLDSIMKDSTETGLVGFFDILGYQNLLEKNEPEAIAEDVLPMLTGIGQSVSEDLKLLGKKDEDEAIPDHSKQFIEDMNWLVFSDTVLLTLPVKEPNPSLRYGAWLTFFMACIGLQSRLFNAGLPARGAIDFGKFFVKDTCFAGRTIVNAYRLSDELELAACVLTDAAATELHSVCDGLGEDTGYSMWGTFVLEHLIPTKTRERHMLTLMAHTYNLQAPNIHQAVMAAFWGNNKDLPVAVREKVTNTEQWLEFLHHRRESEKESNNEIQPTE